MSPYIEYWGIPSPGEEQYAFNFGGEGVACADSTLSGSRRMFVLDIECDEEEADFIPESFE
jgi:hypothetical protein